MNDERFFLDTAYVQGVLNGADTFHDAAMRLLPRVQAAREVWTTESILTEVGNALSAINRTLAAPFIRSCYAAANVTVVPVDTALLLRALALYEARPDKTWGLTDCISFVVMQEHGLTLAATSDRHFVQAGFRAVLRDM